MRRSNDDPRQRTPWTAVTGALHNGLACFGLLVLAFLAVDETRLLLMPTQAPGTAAAAFGKVITADAMKDETLLDEAPDPKYQALGTYVSRKYRVAADAAVDLVGEAYTIGQIVGLDPLLILAVISVESRFNPIAESDYGAKGLMQVVPRFHLDKLLEHGGEPAVLQPRTNMLVGAQILKEYIRRAGSLEAGLQLYAGAPDDSSQGYAQRVVTERQRLHQVLKRPGQSGTSV